MPFGSALAAADLAAATAGRLRIPSGGAEAEDLFFSIERSEMLPSISRERETVPLESLSIGNFEGILLLVVTGAGHLETGQVEAFLCAVAG